MGSIRRVSESKVSRSRGCEDVELRDHDASLLGEPYPESGCADGAVDQGATESSSMIPLIR